MLAFDIGSGDPSQRLHTPHRGIWRPHLGHTAPDMVAAPKGFPTVGCTSPDAEVCEESCWVNGFVQ